MARPSLKPPSFLTKMGFPLALIVILLLALPGVVLFIYHLTQREGPLNAWLEENLKLSYHLSLPWQASLILLLIPLALILLYFLKLKRKPLRVPSTFLWRKSIEDLHVNSLFQWLRNNMLLLFQLLILVAILYSVMAFRLHGNASKINRYIIIIDNSASMAAVDVAPSRLEWAKEEALKEIDARSDSDQGMLIVFNSSAQTLQPFTNERNLLRQKVKAIPQTLRPTRIDEALRLAESLANPQRSVEDVASRPADAEPGKERTYAQAEGYPTDVHLFSDGRFPEVPGFSLGNLQMRFHAAGKVDYHFDTALNRQVMAPGPESTDNVAIVSFNATRRDKSAKARASGDETREPKQLQVAVGVRNYRFESAEARVQLETRIDNAITGVYEKNILVPARVKQAPPVNKEGVADETESADSPGEALAQFLLPPLDESTQMVLHARLAANQDKFPQDDQAWLAVGLIRKARILLVTPGNRFLQAFFDDEAAKDVALTSKMLPAELSTDAYRKPAAEGAFDLVIFDRCGPAKEEEMPRANTFFMGQAPPPWTWKPEDRVEFPHVRGWLRDHPLLQDITALYEIGISEAYRWKDAPRRTPRLIETEGDMAVLLSLNRDSFTDLVLTFPLLNRNNELVTNWPLQPSFPLFLRNVIGFLGNFSDQAGEERVQPGQVKTLRPDVVFDQLRVVDPDGKDHEITRGKRADFSFGATDLLGVYKVLWPNGTRRDFAVNLLDRDESHIEPRSFVQIGAQRIDSGQERGQPRDLWPWLVLVALALTLAEWYLYNRRIYY